MHIRNNKSQDLSRMRASVYVITFWKVPKRNDLIDSSFEPLNLDGLAKAKASVTKGEHNQTLAI